MLTLDNRTVFTPGGGDSDIFMCRQARVIFGGFKILNFKFFRGGGGGQNNEYFCGYDEIVDFILGGGGVFTKINYFWGSFVYIFRLFKVKVQNWNVFRGLINFKYILGYAWYSWYLEVNSRCCVQAYISRKKNRVIPGVFTNKFDSGHLSCAY